MSVVITKAIRKSHVRVFKMGVSQASRVQAGLRSQGFQNVFVETTDRYRTTGHVLVMRKDRDRAKALLKTDQRDMIGGYGKYETKRLPGPTIGSERRKKEAAKKKTSSRVSVGGYSRKKTVQAHTRKRPKRRSSKKKR